MRNENKASNVSHFLLSLDNFDYTLEIPYNEKLEHQTPLQRAREGSPPYPTCCYALLCALYNARSQSVSEAM